MTVCIHPLQAQEIAEEEDGQILTGEIVIEKDRKLVLPQARKIYQKVTPPSSKPRVTSIPNNFRSFEFSPEVKLPSLRAASPKLDTDKDRQYNHYLKVGYGNFQSPLAQADLGIYSDKTKILRARLDHLSFGEGAKDGKNSASVFTRFGLNGKVIGDEVVFSAGVNYTLTTDYFYGYENGLDVDRSTIKHKYNFFDADMAIADANDDNELDYSVSVRLESMKDNYAAKESAVIIRPSFSISKSIYLDNEIVLSKYEQSAFDANRNFFRVNPYYAFGTEDLKMQLGFSFTSISKGGESFGSSVILPYAKARYQVSKSISLYAKLDGGMQQNRYSDYAKENPYLLEDVLIQNSRVNYDFNAGTSILPSSKVSLKANVGLQSVRNFGMYFQSDVLDATKFDLMYLGVNTKVFSLASDIQASFSEKHSAGLRAKLMSYSAKGVSDFYNLPTSEIEVYSSHKMLDKLKLEWGFNFLGGMKGEILSETPSTSTKLSAITDLHLNLDYQINERSSAFIQFDNLLNKNYERYFNYPMKGLQVKLGVGLRF